MNSDETQIQFFPPGEGGVIRLHQVGVARTGFNHQDTKDTKARINRSFPAFLSVLSKRYVKEQAPNVFGASEHTGSPCEDFSRE